MQRFCLSLELRDDPVLIAEYVRLHASVWPEIQQSILAAGVTDMQIFLLGTRLCMILEADDSFTMERKAAMDAANPKVLEWETLMTKFQKVNDGDNLTEKWQPMQKIFQLDTSTATRH